MGVLTTLILAYKTENFVGVSSPAPCRFLGLNIFETTLHLLNSRDRILKLDACHEIQRVKGVFTRSKAYL
jgi:hypothetical protein